MFDPQHCIKTEHGDASGPSIGCRLKAWSSEAQGHTQLHTEFKNSLIYRRHFLKTKQNQKSNFELYFFFFFLLGLKQATMFLFNHLTRPFFDHSIQSCSMNTSILGTSGWPHILFSLIFFHTFFLNYITYDTNYQLYLNMNFKVPHHIISVWALSVTYKRYMHITWKSFHVLIA